MLNYDRMLQHFLELVSIDSESRDEVEVARNLSEAMRELGAETLLDNAGEVVGGNSGNLFVRFFPTSDVGAPLLLSAHMDTVVPGRGVKPRVVDGRVVTDGTTVLGADDKSGCAVITEVMRTIVENDIPHGDIEIAFTICEEQGLLGAKNFDTGRLDAKYGLIFDSSHSDVIATEGPAAVRMEWIVNGVESHAGVAPEAGISAIAIAADAIGRMKLGRIDLETTANIGVFQAAGATNIVPKRARVLGEARSRNKEKLEAQTAHMSRCFHEAVAHAGKLHIDGKERSATLEEHIRLDYEGLNIKPSSPVVTLVRQAAAKLGREITLGVAGGGCDANVFNRIGLECVNVGSGMRANHTVNEWLDIAEFNHAADLLFEAVRFCATPEGARLLTSEQ